MNHVDALFLEQLRKEVDLNLSNDQFSVEELARNIGMSRSQLHRKLSNVTGQSVSQFIREYRLQLSMELLREGKLTAAEVSGRVGFGSATYFSKCFNEYYGFPPGEVKARLVSGTLEHDVAAAIKSVTDEPDALSPAKRKSQTIRKWVWASLATFIGIVACVWFLLERQQSGVERYDKSIAILPFKNLSADKGNEYFSEGVIEAIRTSLSQVGELRVISRTSVEQYRDTDKPARTIANELGVSALLEGSVQRSNNKVRIEVRLVDGASEIQVWAESFDRELQDVFAIQHEIAYRVANELHAKLTAEERSNLSKTDTKNLEAYDLYLKGVYQYRTYTNKGAHNAIGLLTRAIELDPNYAKAHAWLANSHIGLATIWGAELSAIEALQNGKPYIDKALALDPDLDQARMLMGFYKLYYDWDLQGAASEYERSIKFGYPDALALYTDYLNFVGRHKEALMLAERLNASNPYYPNSRMILSYFYNGKITEANEFSVRRMQVFNNYYTLDSYGFLLLNTGRYNESIDYFNKAIALEGIRYPRMLGWMGAAYAKMGEREQAMEIIREFQRRLPVDKGGSISFFTAVIYSALDDKHEALAWLNKAYNNHDMEMPWLLSEPQFSNLHDDPAFKRIASEMGFDKMKSLP